MASTRLVGILFITFTFCVSGCLGAFSPRPIRHYVNGRQGWVPHPFQDYNQWAGNNRFLAHDTLYFRYNKEQDSVLEVSKEDYDSCNTDHPIEKKQDGDSEFELKQPGPYYFISGNKTHCQQGQKLIVQVLHYPSSLPSPPTSSGPTFSPPGVHPHPRPPPGATSPSSGTPGASAPSTSPSSGTPGASAPSTSPSSGTPGASGPATSPSSVTTPAPSTSPSSGTPGASMSPSSGTPGASGPATSPASSSPVMPGPASGPGSSTGAASPPSPVAPGPEGLSPGPGAAVGGPGASAPGAAGGGPGASAPGAAAGGPGSSAPGAAAGGPGSAETPSDQPSSDITSPSGSKNSAVKGNGFSMGVGVLSVLVSLIMWLN